MASIHGDVASAIGQQVEQMILQAKKDSEARVRHDLANTKSQLKHMEGLVEELGQRMARCRANAAGAGASQPSETVDRVFLSQKVSQLEQKWGAEVKALKQDLHRTILAHNHNSDLMRHHRDALEEARRKLEQYTQPKATEVELQIERLDRVVKTGVQKQQLLDSLTDRLQQLEAHVNELFPVAMPGMPGGMDAMMHQQRAAMAGTAKQQRQPSEPKETDAAVTEGEFRSRVDQAVRESQSRNLTFNKEAPVFVPSGATPTEATSAGVALNGDPFGAGDADDEDEDAPEQ